MGTWIRTKIDGVRVLAASSCLPRLKPGTVLLREYQFPPARRDVFRGDSDGLEAGFREGESGSGRAQGLEPDLLQGVGEEPAL